jgi:hypothetical protein
MSVCKKCEPETDTPCDSPPVSSSIGGQLAMNKPSIFRIILEEKVARCWLQRTLWVAEWVICIGELEFNKEIYS